MAGTSMKCTKCGRYFRQIDGLDSDVDEVFRTRSFFCCGLEHCKSLFELGEYEKAAELQARWVERTIDAFKSAAEQGRAKPNWMLLSQRFTRK